MLSCLVSPCEAVNSDFHSPVSVWCERCDQLVLLILRPDLHQDVECISAREPFYCTGSKLVHDLQRLCRLCRSKCATEIRQCIADIQRRAWLSDLRLTIPFSSLRRQIQAVWTSLVLRCANTFHRTTSRQSVLLPAARVTFVPNCRGIKDYGMDLRVSTNSASSFRKILISSRLRAQTPTYNAVRCLSLILDAKDAIPSRSKQSPSGA